MYGSPGYSRGRVPSLLGRRATVALAVALFRMYFVGPRRRGRIARKPYLAIKSNRRYGLRGSTPGVYDWVNGAVGGSEGGGILALGSVGGGYKAWARQKRPRGANDTHI